MPTIGFQPRCAAAGTRQTAPKMMPTLNMAGETAGVKKRLSEFSIPVSTAARATSVRNGSTMRLNVTVSSSLPGTAA